MQVQQSKDPEGLRVFYYLVQVRSFLPVSVVQVCLCHTCAFTHLLMIKADVFAGFEVPRLFPHKCSL